MASREVCRRLKDTFAKADLDGDGRISRREMEQILVAVTPLSPRDIDRLLGSFDTDGDGYLDYEEFAEWLAASNAEVAASRLRTCKFMWGARVTVAEGPAKGRAGWLQEVMESEDKSLFRVSFNASGSDTIWTSEVAKATVQGPGLAPCEFTGGAEVVVAEGPAKGRTGFIHIVMENEYRRLYRVDFDAAGSDTVWTSEVEWPKPREQQASPPPFPAIGSGVASPIGSNEKNEGTAADAAGDPPAARPQESSSGFDFEASLMEAKKTEEDRISSRIQKTSKDQIETLEVINGKALGKDEEAAVRKKVREQDSKSHPSWRLKAALTNNFMSIIVDGLLNTLDPGCPENMEIAFSRAFPPGSESFVSSALRKMEVVESLSTEFVRISMMVRSTDAATGAELNDKFNTSKDKGFEMGFEAKAAFFSGLEARLGSPDPRLTITIILEHCVSCDSKRAWTTGNYGITTTTFTEFLLVLREVIMQCHNDTKCELPAEWRAAAQMFASIKVLPAVEDWPTEWPKETINVEHGRKPEKQQFLLALLRKNKQLEGSGDKVLTLEEGILLRLYTGPLFEKYNGVARGGALKGCDNPFLAKRFRELCGKPGDDSVVNRYVTSIHTLASGVVKLSKTTEPAKVYRGLGGNTLPKQFWDPDEYGCKGGVEPGFMSTTTNREVAMRYSGDGSVRMVLEMESGLVDRGADIRDLSQYPEEREILFAPLTSLEVRETETEEGVLVVKTRANINLRSPTIDEVLTQRFQSLLRAREHNLNQAEMQFRSPEWQAIHQQGEKVRPFLQVVEKKMDAVLSKEASSYNEDRVYLSAMEQLTLIAAEVRDFKSSLLRDLGSQLGDTRLVELADEREGMEVTTKSCSFTFKTDLAGMGDLWVFRVLGLRKAQDGLYYPISSDEKEYRSCLLYKKPFASQGTSFPEGMALLSINGRRDLEAWALEVQEAWRVGVQMDMTLRFGGLRSGQDFATDLLCKIRSLTTVSHVSKYLLCNQKQKELDLGSQGLKDEEAEKIFRALGETAGTSQLELLILSDNSLGARFASACAAAVSQGCLPRMKLLQLYNNKSLGQHATELTEMLTAIGEHSSCLEVLSLDSCSIKDSIADSQPGPSGTATAIVPHPLVSAFGRLLQRLQSLQLLRNNLGPQMSAALAAAIGEATRSKAAAQPLPLKQLWLHGNPALFSEPTAAGAFVEGLRQCSELEELRLAQTGLAGAKVVPGLAAALPSLGKLRELSLYKNPALFSECDAAGIQAFMAGLGSCSALEDLRLFQTGLAGAEVVTGLAAALPSLGKLRVLWLDDNPMLFSESDAAGTRAFMMALGECSELEELHLFNTGLSAGADAFASTLPRLQRLRRVSLRYNPKLDDAARQKIQEAADAHGGLEDLQLYEGAADNCPGRHGLVCASYNGPRGCDICRTSIPPRSPLWTCSTCEFDVCQACRGK